METFSDALTSRIEEGRVAVAKGKTGKKGLERNPLQVYRKTPQSEGISRTARSTSILCRSVGASGE